MKETTNQTTGRRRFLENLFVGGAGALAASAFGGCAKTDSDSTAPLVRYTREQTNQNLKMDEGVNLTSWWYDDYTKPHVESTLLKLHDLGVESIAILTTYYQAAANSTYMGLVYPKTPLFDGIERVINRSKELGMKVILKPTVDVQSGAWRGDIQMASEAEWTEWFSHYNSFMEIYANLAQKNGADGMVIGTELEKTVNRPEWNMTIDNIRAAFPEGELTYSANWDGYQNVPFWDKLDSIGISSYFPLTQKMDPSLLELMAGWEQIAQQLDTFSASKGKKITISEVGYQSLDGTNRTPWWTYGALDPQEQADCYRAMFETLFNRPSIKGIYPWMCYHDPYKDVNAFDFIGKPAEVVVNDFYHREDKS